LINCSPRSEEKRPILGCLGPSLSARWPSRALHCWARAQAVVPPHPANAAPGRRSCAAAAAASRPAQEGAAAAPYRSGVACTCSVAPQPARASVPALAQIRRGAARNRQQIPQPIPTKADSRLGRRNLEKWSKFKGACDGLRHGLVQGVTRSSF
jgi:hypothetical protein